MERPKQSYFDDMLENIMASVRLGRNIILHGPGGVGKSFSLRHITKILRANCVKVYVTALTGVAALTLAGDRENGGIEVTTLHRFAGVGTAQGDVDDLVAKIKSKSQSVKRWTKCKVLIIDEVSMLGGLLFEKLDSIAKIMRNNEEPFGGIQLIFSGDMLQLSPVKDFWAFKTDVWKALNLKPFVLEIPYRYNDEKFFSMLLRIRVGNQTDEDYKVIRGRVRANKKMQEILASLAKENAGEIIKPTMLFSKRIDVESFNMTELEKLEGEKVEFIAKDSFSQKKYNTIVVREEYIKQLDDAIPMSVAVKVGAQVMLKKNLDVNLGLVNGSRGVVSEIIKDEALIVKFLNGCKLRIDLQVWEIENKYVLVTRTQIPFVLAWATTIHKAQGSTLDYAVVDLGPSVFSDGQAYVALSRVANANGLFISEFVTSSIKVNKDAVAYAKELQKESKDNT